MQVKAYNEVKAIAGGLFSSLKQTDHHCPCLTGFHDARIAMDKHTDITQVDKH